MRNRYRMFIRGPVFWVHDGTTNKQRSLRTRDRRTATRLVFALNEAELQPAINLQMAKAYASGKDPTLIKRTWEMVFREMLVARGWIDPDEKISEEEKAKRKPKYLNESQQATLRRWLVAHKCKSFDCIRNLALFETNPSDFHKVLNGGKVSANTYLRRIHNYALDLGYLLTPVMPKKQWPKIAHKTKRSVSREEHRKIIAAGIRQIPKHSRMRQ